MLHKVLTIAGSDSGGGAGIQGDLKTLTAHGIYATSAITAVTVQNTRGISDIFPVPEDIVSAQIKSVLEDIGVDAIKTGLLHSAGTIREVAATMKKHAKGIPVVVDPVMTAKDGTSLFDLFE